MINQMINKDEFLQSVGQEIHIIKHLFTQIPEGGLSYRPTEGQRSTSELLQYLSHIGSTLTTGIKEGGITKFKEEQEKSMKLTPEEFVSAMDAQQKIIADVVSSLSDEEMNADITMFGSTGPRRLLLVNFVLKHLVAYRMQLFLYAKQAGNADMSTMDNWAGVSAKK